MIDLIVLVDEQNKALGLLSKPEAYKRGLLHRTFSVFVFNKEGEMLIQKRANNMRHSGGLWSNACSGHPRPLADIKQAAMARLREEMGLECIISPAFAAVYKAKIGKGLTAHELNHIFTGICDRVPRPDGERVSEWAFVPVDELTHRMTATPTRFTQWFTWLMKHQSADIYRSLILAVQASDGKATGQHANTSAYDAEQTTIITQHQP